MAVRRHALKTEETAEGWRGETEGTREGAGAPSDVKRFGAFGGLGGLGGGASEVT